VLERRDVRGAVCFVCAVHVARTPTEFTRDLLVPDDRIDLGDGRKAGIPNGLSMIAAESRLERRQATVGHSRHVRRRVAGVDRSQPLALEEGNRAASLRQEISRSQAGNTAAYDQHVDSQVGIQAWKSVDRCQMGPIRRAVSIGAHCLPSPLRPIAIIWDEVRRSGARRQSPKIASISNPVCRKSSCSSRGKYTWASKSLT